MSLRLVVRARAESDIADARRWYETITPGLGSQFLDAVEAGLSTIITFPEASPIVHGRLRRCLMRRFPYGIFYVLAERRIVVVAVLHGRKEPRDWEAEGPP